MIFATIILLFFVIDILTFHRFILFGMQPLSYLVTAFAIFTGLTYFKNVIYYPEHKKRGLVYAGTFFILLYGIYPTLPPILIMTRNPVLRKWSFLMLIWGNNVGIVVSILVLLSLLFNASFRDRVYRYLLISVCSVLGVNLCNRIVAPMPSLYLRYSGFLLLPVLFSWLMMLYHIVRMRYSTIEEMTEEMAPSYQDEIKETL